MPKTPNLGSYLVKNPLLYGYLALLDFICIFLPGRNTHVINNVKSILLVHLGHKGDAILATSVLPVIKARYPHAKIGMLISSVSQEILLHHPIIDHLHILDHPKLNRSKLSFLQKWTLWLKQLLQVYKETKTANYDLSIDLYPYYPNTHFLTWLVNIPQRIGYTSGGGGKLLTQGVVWEYKRHSITEYFLKVLEPLGIISNAKIQPNLPLPSQEHLNHVLKQHDLKRPYCILHPYSGYSVKHWKDEFWRSLAQLLSPYEVIFTGGSKEEKIRIEDLKLPIKNMATLLSFEELKAVVSKASFIVCVDTMIAHLAACYGVPCFILYSGIADPLHWLPPTPSSHGLYRTPSCFPCFKKKGCSSMSCLWSITPQEVLSMIKNHISFS